MTDNTDYILISETQEIFEKEINRLSKLGYITFGSIATELYPGDYSVIFSILMCKTDKL